MAAEAGVDDVHLIAALALHRRMTEAELRHAVGDRVYDAFAPARPALQPRRRGPRQPGVPRHDRQGRGGRDQQAGRRERPARLRQHQPRRRWTAAGSRPPPAWPATVSSATTTTCSTMQHSPSLHGPPPLASCTTRNWRMGKVISDAGVKIFQIETTLNNDTFGTPARCRCLQKREWEWTGHGPRARSSACKAGLDRLSASDAPHRSSSRGKAPYG